MIKERRRDRRRAYSLRGHPARLKETGRIKQVSLVVVAMILIATGTFARCSSSSITGPGDAPSPPSRPSPSLTAVSSETSDDYMFTAINTCTGEVVTLVGHINQVMSTDFDLDGITIKVHQTENGRGTEPTGTAYQGSREEESTIRATTPPSETNIVQNLKLISKSSTDNLLMRTQTHLTINANGQATAHHERAVVECNGRPN